ncbi:MAG: pyridoxamine 5'-phosphate oxidase family protein [Chloroflexota bacterium]
MVERSASTRRLPRLSRPRMAAGYGIPTEPPDPARITWEDVTRKLEASRNYWICTTRPDGRPHSAPVWGVWVSDTFVFGTDPRSQKWRNLRRNPAVTVHLESGDDVVILEGVIEEVTDEDITRGADDAYDAKYGLRLLAETGDAPLLALQPDVAHTWLETDFLATAARWDFD